MHPRLLLAAPSARLPAATTLTRCRPRLYQQTPASSNFDHVHIPPQNFAKPTLSSLNFYWRFIKFSLLGVSLLVGTTLAALQGTHLWVEFRELAPEQDPDGELARWGWARDAERWSGGSRGGTDPALGWKGRHALRSAWAAQHWGTGTGVLSHAAFHRAQREGGAVEARLEYAHDFLNIALAIALDRAQNGAQIRPQTVSEILARHAATLERVGSKGALYDARAEYERVWEASGERGLDAARLALKLGDVCARLGDADEAIDWWGQALSLASASDDASSGDQITRILVLPNRLPASPHAQRTVAAALTSLSAHYAQVGQLQDARAVQRAGLVLLNYPAGSDSSPSTSSPSQVDRTQTSAPHALHALFLQHRGALLALHRAEVGYALRATDAYGTLDELSRAAASAENIAARLVVPDFERKQEQGKLVPPPADAPLVPAYKRSRTLRAPAGSLLRDARRTAVHAWTLAGVLHERNARGERVRRRELGVGRAVGAAVGLVVGRKRDDADREREDAQRAALVCYERALAWAGGHGGEGQPGAGVLESEWTAVWRNYARAREAVQA